MNKIFISYSSKEYDVASKIRTAFMARGMQCWMAPESIPIGSNYAIEIPKAIQDCQVFVLILSENSQNSVWVRKEIDLAVNLNKLIFPIRIGNYQLISPFSFYLTDVQMMQASDEPDHLAAKLEQMLNPPKAAVTDDSHSSGFMQTPPSEYQQPQPSAAMQTPPTESQQPQSMESMQTPPTEAQQPQSSGFMQTSPTESQQPKPAAADIITKIPKKKGIIIGCAAILIILLIVIIGAATAKPTFKGKDTADEYLKVAQQYLSSKEYKYEYNENFVYDYTPISFNGKIGNYYQFNYIGTYHDKTTGKDYTVTEEDSMAIVLQETDDGITLVPPQKWVKEFTINNEDYKANSLTARVYRVGYNYSTGNLYTQVRIYNGYSYNCTLTELEVTITDSNGTTVASGTAKLTDNLQGTYYIDKTIDFVNGDTYFFDEDLSDVTWKTNITYNS